MTTSTLNAPRPMKLWDCDRTDNQVIGAYVEIDGEMKNMGIGNVRLIEDVRFDWRDDKGNRVRPQIKLTDDEVASLEFYGLSFEPTELDGYWQALVPFKIVKYYRQGF